MGATAAFGSLRRFVLLLVTTAVALSAIGSAHADVQYIYDEAGRLTGVVAPSGNAARYTYDAAGNITAISSTVSGTVSIIEFSPNSGPIGTVVTIWGTGFSATPASNTVKFNGTTATVSSASVNKLVVTVPSGATTGTISVTSPGGSATSAQTFTVTTAGSGAPTVTTFTPTMALPGTAVTVNGTNFQLTPSNNHVRFNVAPSAVTTASATQVQTTVPAAATSGHISVTTPYGTATSSADFYVVPVGKTTADITFTSRITVNGAGVPASFATANKIGLALFDGTQGTRVRLILSPVTITNATITIYSPTGEPMVSNSVGVNGDTLITPILPVTGTYTIRIENLATGSLTMTLKSIASIAIPGTASGSTTLSAENTAYTFNAVGGQGLGLGVTNIVTSPAGGGIRAAVYSPDGSLLINCNSFITAPGDQCDILPTVTGQYLLLIDPPNASTASFTLTLSADVPGTVTVNGSAFNFTTATVGQNARVTFLGTSGQNYTVVWTGSTFANSYINIYKPDGTPLDSVFFFGQANGTKDLAPLPVSGTYTLLVTPYTTSTGLVNVAVKQEVAGTLAIDGSSTNLTLAGGQNARYKFTATSTGQKLGLGVSAFSTTPSGGNAALTIFGPTGSYFTSCNTTTAPGDSCDLTLGATGDYNLFIDPSGVNAANMTLTLSNDRTGSITVNGAAVPFNTTRVGENARYTFTGVGSQAYRLLWSSNTFAGASVYVLRPDGSTLDSVFVTAASGSLNLGTLPSTGGGTYTVFITPLQTNVGNISVSIASP